MRFQLVASDIDGTLLRTDDSLSARTKFVIHRVVEKSLFVLSTGRPARWVHPVAEMTEHHGLAVCSNGAVTVDLRTEQIVDSCLITRLNANSIIDAVRSVIPDAAFAVERRTGFAHDPAYIPVFFEYPKDTVVAPIKELIEEGLIKMLFRHPDMNAQMLEDLKRAIGDNGSVTYGSTATAPGSKTLIEVMAPGVTKASALQRICEQRGFGAEDVVAFGDMPNDIEMIGWAGHGVAMANAHELVQEVADEITDSNDRDGVAMVLERELGL